MSTADIYCDVTLAMATPATESLHTMTKNRLSRIFTTPENASIYTGFLVSPTAENTALPKLYIPSAGIPRKYILRYSAAPSISSSLVFITSRITPMSAHIHAAE